MAGWLHMAWAERADARRGPAIMQRARDTRDGVGSYSILTDSTTAVQL